MIKSEECRLSLNATSIDWESDGIIVEGNESLYCLIA